MKNIAALISICLILASCAPAPAKPIPSTLQPEPSVTVTATSTTQASQAGGLPNFDHIVLILLENRNYTDVIGSPQMPLLNALARQNVLLSNFFAVRHPSLPNYIALMSGSTQNITSDCIDCFVNQPNLADRIEASGRTWKSYLESMPSPCFIGDANLYVQKHNPLIYFDSVRLDTARCERSIVPLINLDNDLAANQLPNFSFIMPDMCNSGHECKPEIADKWVSEMVAKLQASPALGENSLIIITYDEGDKKNTRSCCGLGEKAGGQITTVLISPLARQSFNDNTAYSHYSLLKMILSAWDLPDLGQSATAPRIEAPWNSELGSTMGNTSANSGSHLPSDVAHPTGITSCVPSSPTSEAYTVTVCFSDPASNSNLPSDKTISATANFTGKSPGVQRMVFYLDGSYLLTDYAPPYTFTLPTAKWVDGSHTLSVEALMRDNFTSQRASLWVNFNNGVTIPPVNTNQFQPSSGITPANGAPFIVAVGGDGASGETYAGQVSDLVAALNPNLFLYLGDVYSEGSQAEFYNWYGTQTAYFGRFRSITNPTIGNHEYSNGAAPGYFDYWDNIPNYYSYNAGGWHFISLNSNTAIQSADPQSAQYQWLQQDLAANSGACTIAYYHHPLFNIGPEGSTSSMTDIWKLLAQYGVDIVINGHDHDYQRWVPLDGSGQPDPNGVTEFVAGAAGHGMQTFTTSDSRVAYSNDANPTVFGILLLQLNQNGTNFSYQTINGATLDSGVIPCLPTRPDTLAPDIPGRLSAIAANATRVDLTWSASNDDTGVNGYTIYRNGTPIATLPGASQGYSDTTAKPTTAYTYTIEAIDLAGNHSAVSAPAAATTPNLPASLTFPVLADTYVSSSNPNSNYGTATSWRLDGTPDLHTYLRFNVQGLAGTPIEHAQLLVYASNTSGQNISVKSVADNWEELSTNYTNAPALRTTLATSGTFTAGSWISLDVTSYVTGEGTYSFGLTTPSISLLSFPSRESGINSAQLMVSFVELPTATPTATSTPVQTGTPTPTATVTPTPVAISGQSLTFTPFADTYVNAGSTGTNYGSSISLRADASPDVHSYLRFNVQGLGGKTISRARLLIYANTGSAQGISALAVADNDWSELTMNYNDAPALGNTLVHSNPFTTGGWVTLEVTSYLTGEGMYSFGVTTPGSTAISLSSRESGANSPQLIIEIR